MFNRTEDKSSKYLDSENDDGIVLDKDNNPEVVRRTTNIVNEDCFNDKALLKMMSTANLALIT